MGYVLGWGGELVSLAAWRPWVIGVVAVVAVGLGVRRQPPPLGRQRQVPRRWAPTVSLSRVYVVWGLLLGSGVATPIYHTAALLLFGGQLTAGPGLGLASGAIFGATRQVMALVPVLGRFGPERTMELLTRFRPLARRANVALAAGGGLALVLASRW